MANTIEAQIQAELESIEQQLQGYDDLVRRRTQLQAMLDISRGNVTIGPSSRSRAAAPRQRRGKFDQDAVLSFLAEQSEPVGATQIADVAGISGNSLSVALKRMTEEGLIEKTGQRRATRYAVPKG